MACAPCRTASASLRELKFKDRGSLPVPVPVEPLPVSIPSAASAEPGAVLPLARLKVPVVQGANPMPRADLRA